MAKRTTSVTTDKMAAMTTPAGDVMAGGVTSSLPSDATRWCSRAWSVSRCIMGDGTPPSAGRKKEFFIIYLFIIFLLREKNDIKA